MPYAFPMNHLHLPALALLASLATSLPAPTAEHQPDPRWRIHDAQRPRPTVIHPGSPGTEEAPGQPPSDATPLFNGANLEAWCNLDGSPTRWIVKQGAMECLAGSGYIRTLRAFGDCQLHLEWAAPTPVQGHSQGRGNSGVFLMGKYEVQILDSYDNPTYADGQAAAAYGQYPPLVNACRPPGQWQTYDIIFTRPRFDSSGALRTPARLTVLHNGVLVQHDVALTGPTGWQERASYQPHPDRLPLQLQDHGNPVRFRNIWIRELEPGPAEYLFSPSTLEPLVGLYEVDAGLSFLIERQESQLIARLRFGQAQRTFPLHAASPLDFFVPHLDAAVTFQTNAQGNGLSLVYTLAGEARAAKRVR